ncbi:PQQ-binding-like beta-propeller repeat protein [Solwaraspora sp. WMMA2056]|uniref:outer membrane protein assembly factor BamB family protein n=1 Tax=Solwaraspora sp. WMMA2056 TaxID=3015161 RepID=UPI00259B6F05|nr:PQQ-binding-like beta-propeller repeat protein [Solwaraspora sp. WMMA2056]WJK43571.1 PQQ-binding-like beta-propeller repeat protein [Solwaraspora sp. WMMA2056]
MVDAPAAGTVGSALGVDFGTSHTVAALAWPDGSVQPLFFDGFRQLPSAVFLTPGADLIVGRDALHAARTRPDRLEPHPKRRIDQVTVALGDTEVEVAGLIAAVLGAVTAEACRVVGGGLPARTVLTHPANWDERRRETLLRAASRAGLPAVTLMAEPVAAAGYFLTDGPTIRADGTTVLVYDLGAGTFDASAVRRVDGQLSVVATRGLDRTGGLDIDAAVVAYLGSVYGPRDPTAWRRLTDPDTDADRRASRQLWDDVRSAKESLSRQPSTVIPIPSLGTDAPLGRIQLEELAGPTVARTVAATRAVLADAALAPTDLPGIFLVGGGSRLPLAATALLRALGVAPMVLEQPETVVAEGAARSVTGPAVPPVPEDSPDRTASAGTASAGPARRPYGWDRRRLLSVAAASFVVGATPVLLTADRPVSGGALPTTTTGPTRGPAPRSSPGASADPGPGPSVASSNARSSPPLPGPEPGGLLWRRQLPGIRHRPTVAAGLVVVLCDDGVCYAVRVADGSTVWTRRVAPGMFRNDVGAPTVVGDRVYVASHDNRLHLLDAATGAVVGTATSRNILTSSPAVDDRLVYLAQEGLETYDPADLTPRWRFDVPAAAREPLLTGDLAVFTTNNGRVYAVDRSTGRQRWRHSPPGADRLSRQLAATEGAIIVTGSNGRCYAIDARDGGLRWRRDGTGSELVGPAAADGVVFTASFDGYVHALGAADGRPRWRTRVDGYVLGRLTVAGPLVYASTTTVVTALRVATGAIAWAHPLGQTSGVRVADSVAYVGGATGWLSALAAPATA